MKHIYAGIALFALLASPAAAQTTSTASSSMKGIREKAREQMEEMRQKAKGEMHDIRENAQNSMKEIRENMKEQIMQKRENMKKEIETERDQLKAKLKGIKDEKKKQIVEHVNDRINDLNTQMVSHFSEVLDKIQSVLNRIIERTDRAQQRGLDVASVRTAITDAQAAIAKAKDAVKAQSGKTYPLAVTAETKLKSEVQAARKKFHDDIVIVREAVQAAQQAVRKAAVALAQVPRINEVPTATTTATTTPPTPTATSSATSTATSSSH